MHQLPYLADRAEVFDAAELIFLYGNGAGYEAATRADRCREMGNERHFCRWRQIERLIVLLSVEESIGTIH
jgi:hypothetical protein